MLVFVIIAIQCPSARAAEVSRSPASFVFYKDSATTERSICNNPELSKLDRKLSEAFRTVLTQYLGDDRTDFLANQKYWLKERDRHCAPIETDCLSGEYLLRIDAMNYLIKNPLVGLADVLWAKGVVCSGNTALIRFEHSGISPSSNIPPAIGGRLARAPAQLEACQLSDGRIVKFKTASVPDAVAHGMCGGDNSEIYSVWIGNAKVISREERAGKCQTDPVRAIFLEGNKLTRCADDIGLADDKPNERHCDDISDRLVHSAHDQWPSATFLTSFSAPGMRRFCDSRIRNARDTEGIIDPDWPRKTAAPINPIGVDAVSVVLDLNNSGKAQPVWRMENALSDFSYWVLPPISMGSVDVKKLTEDPDFNFENARKRGIQVFAGDETPFGDASHTFLIPFRENDTTWFFVESEFRLDLPAEVITRPKSDGTQEVVCEYRITPDL